MNRESNLLLLDLDQAVAQFLYTNAIINTDLEARIA
jgi:hypothetical protein